MLERAGNTTGARFSTATAPAQTLPSARSPPEPSGGRDEPLAPAAPGRRSVPDDDRRRLRRPDRRHQENGLLEPVVLYDNRSWTAGTATAPACSSASSRSPSSGPAPARPRPSSSARTCTGATRTPASGRWWRRTSSTFDHGGRRQEADLPLGSRRARRQVAECQQAPWWRRPLQ